MKLTLEYLTNDLHACREGVAWWEKQNEPDSLKVLELLIDQGHWDWFRWLAVRLMTHQQKVEWACYCAEQVLSIFEKKYPQDQRPRKAIEAAREWLKNPSEATRKAAAAAYAAADYAAYAAAADAAYAAAAAADAAYAAAAADAAADYAADAYAADDAKNKIRRQLANQAIVILKDGQR